MEKLKTVLQIIALIGAILGVLGTIVDVVEMVRDKLKERGIIGARKKKQQVVIKLEPDEERPIGFARSWE